MIVPGYRAEAPACEDAARRRGQLRPGGRGKCVSGLASFVGSVAEY
jgi:hypothetical protein